VQWNAEKPALYPLVLSLMQGRRSSSAHERRRLPQESRRRWQLSRQRRAGELAGACHTRLTRHGPGRTCPRRGGRTYGSSSGNLNYLRTSHYPPSRSFSTRPTAWGVRPDRGAFCWSAGNEQFGTCPASIRRTRCWTYHRRPPERYVWVLTNESRVQPALPSSGAGSWFKASTTPDETNVLNNPCDPKQPSAIIQYTQSPLQSGICPSFRVFYC